MDNETRFSQYSDVISEKNNSFAKPYLKKDVDVLPFVSVIIPVYRDWNRLKQCVDALELQTYPSDRYEIIVVDNDDESYYPPIASRITYVIEKKRGSYAARNKGISVSKGDIICFTDSDCIPKRDWIEEGIKYLFENPRIDAVGGSIELFFANPDKKTSVELYDLVHAFQQEIYIKERSFSVTANLFVPKELFEILGVFNDELKSSGDMEWGQRLSNQGMKLGYCSTAIVRHPARHSIRDLSKKVIRLTGGQYHLADYSGMKGCLSYLYKLAVLFVPPIRRTIYLLFDDGSKLNILEKFRYIPVSWMAHYIRAFEFLHLGLGGNTRN